MSNRIQSKPTAGLSYSPNEPKYWDRQGLDKEIDRVFDICHGCRLCFNLCPSFPALFGAIDAQPETDVQKLTAADRQRVIELCYGCKQCEVRCPYTPAEGHEFQLDFPRLVLRAKAVAAKEQGGVALREKLLGNPDRLGKVAGLTPRLANWANRVSFHRVLMEKMVGIHRDKKLPDFAVQSFARWVANGGLPAPPVSPSAKVALFYTCFVNYNNPEPGKAAVAVLARNNCAVTCPEQNCCGMPALDGGDIEFARRQARDNVKSLAPLVRQGYRVAAINPTCSLMMRKEYPRLLEGEQVQLVAGAVVDTHELLFDLRKQGLFNRDFHSTPGSVAYHLPCHLKAQNIGLRSRDLMRLIPNAQVTTTDACCAHDGTWAMKKEFFALSMKWGKKAFDDMSERGAKLMATDCPLAAIQFEQATGTRPLHPLEVLARAYEPRGFETPVPPAVASGQESAQ